MTNIISGVSCGILVENWGMSNDEELSAQQLVHKLEVAGEYPHPDLIEAIWERGEETRPWRRIRALVQQFENILNPAIKIAATKGEVGLRRLFSADEGRLCFLLVQIYLPPQAIFRIAGVDTDT
ncbi:MAG: hypothetical protein KJ063_25265 [Anaerolineae bacterium]|nr:hypothetical protein [Anaerolineae bacterium]